MEVDFVASSYSQYCTKPSQSNSLEVSENDTMAIPTLTTLTNLVLPGCLAVMVVQGVQDMFSHIRKQ
jgi:hypothetical protein